MKKALAPIILFLTVWSTAVFANPKIEGGLVICLGADALQSVSDDWKKKGCVIQCLVTSDAELDALRKKIQAAGCYGKVSVARYDGKRLPYINNLANLIIVGSGSNVPETEIKRALQPYGSMIIKGARTMKPFPKEMDEWPQYLHGADNNCVAKDTVVGPPRHVQWISGPAWTRSHMGAATITSMVSAGGRLFTIEDTSTAENPFLPSRWRLRARNAFNGIDLWSLDYPNWAQIMIYIKRFPAQLERRLAATKDFVYCTPGLTAPITTMDAATGKVVMVFEGTERTQEFVLHDDVLYAVIGDKMNCGGSGGGKKTKGGKKKRKKKGSQGNKAKKGANGATTPPRNPAIAFSGDGFPLSVYNPPSADVATPTCVIAAFALKTGKEIWRSEKVVKYTGCTMALKTDKLVYQCASGVFCLDAKTGKDVWAVKTTIRYGSGAMPNSLVLSDVAVYSEQNGRIAAYALADGKDYWGKTIKSPGGYQASTDLFVVADALWTCGPCNDAKGVVKTRPKAYDLKTGELIKTIPQKLSKPMGHDRCFRNFATSRFFINSKTGGPDCMDYRTDEEWPCPFTRGTCSMGVLPCNGLFYCGPYSCQCHLTVGLHNFNVYYTNEASLPTKGQIVNVQRAVRFEKGPAYGKTAEPGDAPWPTYRHDARRYSETRQSVPAVGLKRVWKAQLKGNATAPVIAEGKVFVAEVDAYILHALDATTGKAVWQYTAGGRIDSPPTYYKGLLLFGSRDGWVHCVRAVDGKLAWRFRDLPDKMICCFGQLESAWPVDGSVLVKNDTAYFCAGRSSYLDGGLFLYGLNPITGTVKHSRQFYGPYASNGFPDFVKGRNRSENEIVLGTTADVMSSEGDTLYIRHQAFNLDLTDAKPGQHLLCSSGMLEANRNHREYKLVANTFNHRKMWTTLKSQYPTGDIIVADGKDYYSVFSMPVNRHSHFDPRQNGYALLAKTKTGDKWTSKWNSNMPITGRAMVLTKDTVFVAGAPIIFKKDDLAATYEGRAGGALWAASVADGSKQAEYKLDVAPVWDGMAVANGKLFIVNLDGSIDCWGK